MYFVVCLGNTSSNVLQGTARVIADLIFIDNAAADLAGKDRQWFQLIEIHVEAVLLLVHSLVPPISFGTVCHFQ